MSVSTHIDGPWTAKNSSGGSQMFSHSVLDSSGSMVAHCFSAISPLIAAAPELLEELEEVQDLLSDMACRDHHEVTEKKIYTRLDRVEALIAKAKGE